MKRIFIFLVALLPFAALAQDQGGEADRGWLEGIIEDNLSSPDRQVNIVGFQGALSSRATLQELTIADRDGVWLTLRDVVLDWSRSALLRGRVEVSELSAAEIVVARTPLPAEGLEAAPEPEATPFSLPELPVSVNIGSIAAQKLELGAPILGEALTASMNGMLVLDGGEGGVTINAQRTDGGPALNLALNASFANESRQLVINLDAEEAEGGLVTRKLGLPGAPSIDLSVNGTGPIDDYRAEIALATAGQPRLSGAVTLNATTEGGQGFTADLSGDVAPLFLPDYATFFGPDLSLRVEGAQRPDGVLDLPVLSLRAQAITLDGGLAIGADGLPDRMDLTGRIASPDGQPVLLPLSTDQETRIGSADLDVSFDAAQSDDWTANIRATALDRADFDAETLLLQATGRIVPGNVQQVTAALTFAATGLAPADQGLAEALGPDVDGAADIDWVQNEDGVDIRNLRLTGRDYGLTANAQIQGLSSGIVITGDADARLDDLSRAATLAARPLAGAAQATVQGRYTVLEGGFDVTADVTGTDLETGIPQADGLLRGESVIRLSALRDQAGTRIRDFAVNAQTLTATAQGLIATQGSDISANVDFSDLSVMGDAYAGALKGDIRFTGTSDAGQVSLTADGTDIRTGVAEADGLLAGPATIRVLADLEQGAAVIREARVNATTLNLTASGRLAETGSDVTADLNFADLSVLGNYRGGLNARASFTGTPEEGRATLTGQGTGLAIGQPDADRLLAGQSDIDAAIRLTGGRVVVERAVVKNPQVDLNATGTATDNGQNIELRARLANLGLLLPEFPGPLTVSGTVGQRPEAYDLNLTAQGPGGISARAQGNIASAFDSANIAINGSAQAALANVFLSPRSVTGPVSFDMRLNGPLALNSVSGRVGINGGRFADPESGIGLNAINTTVDLSGGTARITASASPQDGGRIGVNGTVGLAAPYTGNLTVDLGRAQFSDPQLFRTIAGGQVRVNGPLTGGAMIAGRIVLEETEVQVPSGGFGSGGSLPGLQHVGEPAAVRATRARADLLEDESTSGGGGGGAAYGLDVTIAAPNQIFIRGRGLDAELGGELRVTGTTDNIIPIGGFDLIRGRLDILGRRLDLSEASLRLEGNFVPQLNVVASSQNNGVTSNVNITGPADNPSVTFTSSPDLPQEEVLAQLLFGRDLSSISALQAAQLASAVATLAGKGGDGIVGNLRKNFGLDDLDVTTNETGEAAVRAGKYISQNVYTEVEVDGQGQSEISLNLDVSDSLTVRGKTGTDEGSTGLGIFWERDY